MLNGLETTSAREYDAWIPVIKKLANKYNYELTEEPDESLPCFFISDAKLRFMFCFYNKGQTLSSVIISSRSSYSTIEDLDGEITIDKDGNFQYLIKTDKPVNRKQVLDSQSQFVQFVNYLYYYSY